jgi:hypothetical protein
MPYVTAIARAPHTVTRSAPTVAGAPPARAASHPRTARQARDITVTATCRDGRGSEKRDQKRQGGSNGKSGGRRHGRLHGACTLEIGNAEFVPRMRPQSIVGHQLIRNLLRESRLEASGDIDTCQFRSLGFVVSRQFLALTRQIRFFRV